MSSRILLVDNDGAALKVMSRALSTHYDTTTAYSAKEALHLMSNGRFAVVVTELRMPGSDALWLIKQARANHHGSNFIVLTDSCDTLSREAMVGTGRVDAILAKPCSDDELLGAIDAAIESRAAGVSQ